MPLALCLFNNNINLLVLMPIATNSPLNAYTTAGARQPQNDDHPSYSLCAYFSATNLCAKTQLCLCPNPLSNPSYTPNFKNRREAENKISSFTSSEAEELVRSITRNISGKQPLLKTLHKYMEFGEFLGEYHSLYMANRRGGLRASTRHGAQPNANSTSLHSGQSQLGTENEIATETQLPPTGSTSNTESTRNSRVRGITCGHGARKAMKNAKTRLTFEFNFGLRRAVCNNAEFFNNEIGNIVRRDCSIRYKEWRLVPLFVRAPLRQKLLTLFDIDVDDEKVQKVIDDQMQKSWRSYRYKLHTHFKKIGGGEDPIKAKSIGHKGVSKEVWDYICDLWDSDLYKERANKNVESRGKRKWETRNGSKSTARHHVCRGAELDAPTGQIETWRIQHWQSEKG